RNNSANSLFLTHSVIFLFLWLAPFLRMCIPVGLNHPYSLMSLISGFTTKTITVYQPVQGISFSATNAIMAADSYFPITFKVNLLDRVFEIASIIWLVVALAIGLALGILYLTTLHDMKDAKHLRDNVYLSDRIQSPAVYGIIKPKILLPASSDPRGHPYILKHERTHIRRLDNLWRLAACLITAVHWFNPLCWLFLKRFLEDMELACDEAAIANYSKAQRKEYALSLVNCAESKSLFASGFGGAKLRTRVESIMSYEKMTCFSALCFSILTVSILVVLLTNAG
ncbi:MAG: M56 family metallopeptidase, partial [Faecousia sp.]